MEKAMRKLLVLAPFAIILNVGLAFAQDVELLPPPPLDPVKVRSVMQRAVDSFITPGYERFRDNALSLKTSMTALCKAPTDEAFKSAKMEFEKTVDAWSHIEIVRIGPVIEKNRFEKILYYPDKKSLGLKQVQRYITDKDQDVTTTAGLTGKSVATQGLGALEYTLYGTGADDITKEKDGFRCQYGEAIAGNLANLGTELATAWNTPGGTADSWKDPGQANAVFRDEREALVALLGILVHASEAIRDQRIETFYKGRESAKFPKAAIYWRSGLTWKSLGANVAAVRTLLDVSGMAELLPPDQRSIVSSIDFIAKSMMRVASTIEPDVEKALVNDRERGKVDYLLLNGKDLIYRLNDQYGSAIGLSSGFSFADGD